MYLDSILEDSTGENEACTPSKSSKLSYSWTGTVITSPSTSCSSGSSESKPDRKKKIRRGRPRLESISHLIMEGSASLSSIKCKTCGRVFPRGKSLHTHLRTHTGEKPYVCDYPGCHRPFAQSGQLKTHQRLHTGEKPFICTAKGCTNHFTHSNRHCPKHPWATLSRSNSSNMSVVRNSENRSKEVLEWLLKYHEDQVESPSQPRRKKLKRRLGTTCVYSSSKISEVQSENSTEKVCSKNRTSVLSGNNAEVQSENSTDVCSENSPVVPLNQRTLTQYEKDAVITLAALPMLVPLRDLQSSNNITQFPHRKNGR